MEKKEEEIREREREIAGLNLEVEKLKHEKKINLFELDVRQGKDIYISIYKEEEGQREKISMYSSTLSYLISYSISITITFTFTTTTTTTQAATY